MHFAEPYWLILLLLLPWLGHLRKKRPKDGVLFSNLHYFDDLPAGRERWLIPLQRYWLRLLFVLAICVAAQPRWPDYRSRFPVSGIDIVICLDTSGSMEEKTFVWQAGEAPISRAEAAKRALRMFIAGGEGFPGRATPQAVDSIGLVTFALTPQVVTPPTMHHEAVLKRLDDVAPRGVLDAGTNIGDALAEGLNQLQFGRQDTGKVLLLVTDGEHNYNGNGDNIPLKPEAAGAIAAALKIPIYTIDTGGPAAADAHPLIRQQREAGLQTHQEIARRTGGRSWNASDGDSLRQACLELDQQERPVRLSFAYRRFYDLAPVLMMALIVLASTLRILQSTLWQTRTG